MEKSVRYYPLSLVITVPVLFGLVIFLVVLWLVPDFWKAMALFSLSLACWIVLILKINQQQQIRKASILELKQPLSHSGVLWIAVICFALGTLLWLIEAFRSDPPDLVSIGFASTNFTAVVCWLLVLSKKTQYEIVTDEGIYFRALFSLVEWDQIDGYEWEQVDEYEYEWEKIGERNWEKKVVKDKQHFYLHLYIRLRLPILGYSKTKIVVSQESRGLLEKILKKDLKQIGLGYPATG